VVRKCRIDHRGSIVKTTVVHYSSVMTREDPQVKLRLPEEMRDLIAALAKQNNRSMNAEIVARLEVSLAMEEGFTDTEKLFLQGALSVIRNMRTQRLAQDSDAKKQPAEESEHQLTRTRHRRPVTK
jgi:hypothetical protein